MDREPRRGVSLGTIVMLVVTLSVLVVSAALLPRLMGKVNIAVMDGGMRSSTNLSEAAPAPAVNDIPLALPTELPQTTQTPVDTPSPEPTSAPTPAVTEAPQVTGTVMLTFGGSICVDDLVRQSGYSRDSGKYDFTENLALIAAEMDSDLTFVTLETVTDPSQVEKTVPNAPHAIMDMLTAAHVDMVALGYNRAVDLGLAGLQSTIAQASERGLETLGTYASQEDADRLRIVDIRGVQVAYLHYTANITNTGKRKMDDATWAMPIANTNTGTDAIVRDIARAREAGAHIVIVSLNWSGTDSISTTSSKMKEFMQSLSDAGADVIVGAGTKAVKEISWVMGKRADGTTRQTLCVWSLGSLLNGERNNGNVAGMLLHLKLTYTGSGVSFERVTYTPTYIWRYRLSDSENYRYRVVASDQPSPEGMDDQHAANAQKALETIRKALGSSPVNLRDKDVSE